MGTRRKSILSRLPPISSPSNPSSLSSDVSELQKSKLACSTLPCLFLLLPNMNLPKLNFSPIYDNIKRPLSSIKVIIVLQNKYVFLICYPECDCCGELSRSTSHGMLGSHLPLRTGNSNHVFCFEIYASCAPGSSCWRRSPEPDVAPGCHAGV